MKVFTARELPKRGVLSRVFKGVPKENAFVEIENLLASTDVQNITNEQVEEILTRYKCDPGDYAQPFADLYRKAVAASAQDGDLGVTEATYLQSLRRTLRIEDSTAIQIHLPLLIPIFQDILQAAIQGVDVTERQNRMNAIAANLSIPEETVRAALTQELTKIFSDAFVEATSDGKLDPVEESKLRAMMAPFKNSTLTEETQEQWDYFKKLWNLSQGNFSDQWVDVRLQSGERCAYQFFARLYETRTVTRRIQYAGPTASIRIIKGVRFRLGDLAVNRVTKDVIKELDFGILYLTTKRLLFDGERKSASIPLKRIINFQCYDDALVIEKDVGKDQVFKFTDQDPRLISATLEGLLKG